MLRNSMYISSCSMTPTGSRQAISVMAMSFILIVSPRT
jgi:hypothetical protein